MHEPLACEQMNFQVFYNLPQGKEQEETHHVIPYDCMEVNGKLNYTLRVDTWSDQLRIENSQYLSIDIQFNAN